jgi:hypothetical protein
MCFEAQAHRPESMTVNLENLEFFCKPDVHYLNCQSPTPYISIAYRLFLELCADLNDTQIDHISNLNDRDIIWANQIYAEISEYRILGFDISIYRTGLTNVTLSHQKAQKSFKC